VPLELNSVKSRACVHGSVRVARAMEPKNEPSGFPKMEGKWQLGMLEAWPWWECECRSSNRAKSGDSGGINLLLNSGRMTEGHRAGKAPYFPSFTCV